MATGEDLFQTAPTGSYFTQARDLARTHLEHLSRLSIDAKVSTLRKTSIVATIGPACNNVETIREMILSGMNIARVNFSHGDHQSHREIIGRIKEARKSVDDHYVAIALDTKGPEIRTGPIEGKKPLYLKEGEEYLVSIDTTGKKPCSKGHIFVDYPLIAEQLAVDKDLFIDDGVICLRVRRKDEHGLHCEVITGGLLEPRKGVNLPSVRVRLPILSSQDREDLLLGIEEGVDVVFASYARDAEEVREVRRAVANKDKNIMVIAKIENEDSLRNIDWIIEEADGVLVARGPLGVETPSAKVAIVQKMIVSKCNRAGKPVIIATQMLESMTTNPRATRAECSDVANAVLDGADCVMLSAETAHGQHPLLAMDTMHRICTEAESAYYQKWLIQDLIRYKIKLNKLETIALAAATAVAYAHASAIVLVTTTGKSAESCAQFRPPVPIVALCPSRRITRILHLYRGILPYYYRAEREGTMDAVEEKLKVGVELGKRRGFIAKGDPVVLITGWPNEHVEVHSMMQLVIAE